MRWVEAEDPKKPGIANVPAVLSHVALAVKKKGYSPRAAWNIARAALIKHGYLKGPYRETDKGVPKMTRKGQKRSMKHAMEPEGPNKFKTFGKDFKGVVEQTYHRKDGKFSSPDSAHFVVRDGEKYKIVRQLRRVKARRLDKASWSKRGDGLAHSSGAEYGRLTPSAARDAVVSAAERLGWEVPDVSFGRETSHIVKMSGAGLQAALSLASATGHVPFVNPWDEGGGEFGHGAADSILQSGAAYLMKRVR